jgi:hypothetical protein
MILQSKQWHTSLYGMAVHKKKRNTTKTNAHSDVHLPVKY